MRKATLRGRPPAGCMHFTTIHMGQTFFLVKGLGLPEIQFDS